MLVAMGSFLVVEGIEIVSKGTGGDALVGVVLLIGSPVFVFLGVRPFVFLVSARRPIEQRGRLTLRLFPILREPPTTLDDHEPAPETR